MKIKNKFLLMRNTLRFLAFFLVLTVFLFLGSVYVKAVGNYPTSYFADIKQPINFNHNTHVEVNGISCESCHTQARRAKSAGIPSVMTCMGCHVAVLGSTPEQQAEIAKISDYWKKKEPIPWQKVHDLPDFVHFSHEAHLFVGFDCSSCHGDVSKAVMPVPQSYKNEIPLSMGWCMSCHRTDWPIDSNNKIAIPKRSTRGGPIVADAAKTADHIKGPVDCLICHK